MRLPRRSSLMPPGAMDVSDGLVGDLTKLCRASGVAAEIEIARVPLSEAARAALKSEPALTETILTGGDDYEIVCTMAPGRLRSFRAAAKAAGVAVTEIGQVATGRGGVSVIGSDGRPLAFANSSYSHF